MLTENARRNRADLFPTPLAPLADTDPELSDIFGLPLVAWRHRL